MTQATPGPAAPGGTPPLSNAPAFAHPGREHRRGIAGAALGVAILIPDTLLMKLVNIDPWALSVLRGGFGGVALILGCWLAWGRGLWAAIRGLRWWGLLLAGLEAATIVLFCLSVAWTTVANTMLAFAATPMIAAGLARILLGERLAPQTAAAIAAVAAGLGLVAAGAWGESALSFKGVAAGLAFSVTIAVFFVALRHLKAQSATPVIGPGWLLGALVALPFAQWEPMSAAQWSGAVLMGAVIMPAAIALLSWASRRVPAAEVSMLTLLEVACAPVLVWAVLGEAPGPWTLAGGALVMGALAAHTLWRLRSPEG
jgi:drug/metabolite transporter (DMT)-like permease